MSQIHKYSDRGSHDCKCTLGLAGGGVYSLSLLRVTHLPSAVILNLSKVDDVSIFSAPSFPF